MKLKLYLLLSCVLFVLVLFYWMLVDMDPLYKRHHVQYLNWLALIWFFIAWFVYDTRRRKMLQKIESRFNESYNSDTSWRLEDLKNHTETVFRACKKARSQKSFEYIKEYLTKDFYEQYQKDVHQELHEKIDIIKDIKIRNIKMVSLRDFPGRDGDMFAMELWSSMIHYTIDEKTQQFISSPVARVNYEPQDKYVSRCMNFPNAYKEYYIFIRHNWKWLLTDVKTKSFIIRDIISYSDTDIQNILKNESYSV